MRRKAWKNQDLLKTFASTKLIESAFPAPKTNRLKFVEQSKQDLDGIAGAEIEGPDCELKCSRAARNRTSIFAPAIHREGFFEWRNRSLNEPATSPLPIAAATAVICSFPMSRSETGIIFG
jgi:hypothetical protein